MTPRAEPRESAAGSKTEDRLLNGAVRLRQPAAGYRVAIDPVLLAAAVPAKPGELALDLGCGVGAAALCLLARVPSATLHGLEKDAELAELALGNAALNGVADRFQVHQGDVLAPPDALAPSGFDHVFCNPPFLAAGAASASPEPTRAAANVEGEARLEHWIAAALRFARDRGSVTFIHRADRLDALIAGLHRGTGGVTIFPLWPTAGGAKPAKRVIVRAWKGSGAAASLQPGLVLHDGDGAFSAAAEAVLRGGQPLDF